MIIRGVSAQIVLNSRNETTISIIVRTDKGSFHTQAPSGKSTGKYEARPYNKNILGDIDTINEMRIPTIASIEEIEKLSRIYSRLIGANTRFALEASMLKAWAAEHDRQLWEVLTIGEEKRKMPMPMGNAIGGGLHSVDGKYVATPEFQEFLFIPQASSFKEAVELNEQAYKMAGLMLKKFDQDFTGEKNDEGAHKTRLTNEHVLKIMYIIAKKLNLRIGLDMAASSFYRGFYKYHDKTLNDTGQAGYVNHLINDYELFSVEDPLAEKEFYFFSNLMERVDTSKTLIVGDDLTVTNYDRLKKAISKKSINAIIIKPNQNGSIFDTARVVQLAKHHGIKTIISHRSGETLDSTIADLAVAWNVDFIKCGIFGDERRAKLLRLIEIEKSLSKSDNKKHQPIKKRHASKKKKRK
jgi:enolase